MIEAKDNWNYSRSILFAWAIPYYHFGLRTSMPVSKTETLGVQLVNGWNNITKPTGGVTTGITSATGENQVHLQCGRLHRPGKSRRAARLSQLDRPTLLLTPNAKFNAYINGDYGQHNNHHSSVEGTNDDTSKWGGIAFAARQQLTGENGRRRPHRILQGRAGLLHRRRAEPEGIHRHLRIQNPRGVCWAGSNTGTTGPIRTTSTRATKA